MDWKAVVEGLKLAWRGIIKPFLKNEVIEAEKIAKANRGQDNEKTN